MTNSPLPPSGALEGGTSVGEEGSLFTGGLVTSTSDVLASTDEAGSVEFEPPQPAPTTEKITTEMGIRILRMGLSQSVSHTVLPIRRPTSDEADES